jgi:hypothetical protein
MIGGTLEKALQTVVSRTETFQSGGDGMGRALLVAFLTLVVMMGLILLAGKWLWNTVLVALVPAVRPAKSIWQMLGLAILIGLLYPGYCC